jgi:hypothetical protein
VIPLFFIGFHLGFLTLKRIGFFCFPIKHSTHTESNKQYSVHGVTGPILKSTTEVTWAGRKEEKNGEKEKNGGKRIKMGEKRKKWGKKKNVGKRRKNKNPRTPTSVFISVIRYASRSELRGSTWPIYGDHELPRWNPSFFSKCTDRTCLNLRWGWDQIPYRPGGWVLHQPPWSFGFDSQTRGRKTGTLC